VDPVDDELFDDEILTRVAAVKSEVRTLLQPNPLKKACIFHNPHVDISTGHATYSIDQEKMIVIVKFGKQLTIAAIEEYASSLRNNPSFRPDFSEIIDLRNVQAVDLQADDFMQLADRIDPFSHEAWRAFVVEDAVQAHPARMHRILRTDKNIETFETVAQAERWIARKPSTHPDQE
jgi:hypothetical protein